MGWIMNRKSDLKPDAGRIKEQPEVYDHADRYEIIGGIRYDLKPSPTVTHQILLSNLYFCLQKSCQANGIIVFAPMDVYLDEDNIVQPDLIFIRNENIGILTNKCIDGLPDLLVEILSPSTASRDRIKKKALYERFGVKEYWIIDPVHATLDRFALEHNKLPLIATYGAGDTVTSELFSCISIGMDELFAPLARFQWD